MALFPVGYTGGYTWPQISPYIASLESSGNPTAYNFTQDAGAYGPASGLYGIAAGTWADFAPQAGIDLGQFPEAYTASPQDQNNVAQLIFNARGLQPWSTAQQAVANAASGAGADIAGSLAMGDNPYQSVPAGSAAGAPGAGSSQSPFFGGLFDTLGSFFGRAMFVALGAIMLLGSFMIFSGAAKNGRDLAAKTVGVVAK